MEIVHLFDTNNYENISSFEEQGSEILALDFSPDSKLLATGNKDETVIILDVGTLQIVHSFPGEEGFGPPKYRVMFLPDGDTLVGGGNNGCLKVWDVLSGENIDASIRCSGRNRINDMAVSSDGKFLAIGWNDGGILIRDTSTWKIIDNFSNDALTPEPTKGIVFLPGGSILVGNIQDNLMIWDVETFKKLGKIKMDMEKIVAFPDGKHVALFYKDTVRILDVEELITK
ncbi:MAG: hypothetical protein IH585_09690 [Anaerolineaceae bacterium]|nr:hypothetical protein [Anaerolineaceae bacterium]